VLDPFLGPPRAVPVAAGLLTGVAVSGAAAGLGVVGIVAAGYAGLLAATLAPELLSGWRRGLLEPVAVTGGSVAAVLALVQLGTAARWGALVVLLLLTALPSGVVAVVRPGERRVAVPVTGGCVAVAALLAVPAGALGAGTAAVLVTAVLAALLGVAAALPKAERAGTEGTAAGCAAAAVALVVAARGAGETAALLAVQGGLTLGWAAWAGRGTPGGRRAWAAGAAELVVAAWLAVHEAGWQVLEGYTLPLAGGLLLAAGPRLLHGPSWPAWGPGLLAAAVPSALLAVVEGGSTRPVLVLALSAAAMVAGPWLRVRTPLLVGAATAAVVAVGLAALTLPWPIATALATGAVLLAVGALRERFPVAGFGLRLADLR
jgi:hypothetical protein